MIYMIVYIDESSRDGTISLGFYLSKGFDRNLRDYIAQVYSKIWRMYGIGPYGGELKFHRFVYELGRRGIMLDGRMFLEILRNVANYIGDLGFIIGVAIKDIYSVEILDPSLYQFLMRLRVRRMCVRKFLLIWTTIRMFRIRRIVFDGGFQISVECLKRILNALGLSMDFLFRSSADTPGLEIADFAAGIARYLDEVHNVSLLWIGNCRILNIQPRIVKKYNSQ